MKSCHHSNTSCKITAAAAATAAAASAVLVATELNSVDELTDDAALNVDELTDHNCCADMC